jgi:uncharacterized protein
MIQQTIAAKLQESITATVPEFTRRSLYLPKVKGKALAVIGPRRGGKTTFLWQLIAERYSAGTPREGLVYFNFEDERLAGMKAAQLQMLLEEYYRLHPQWREPGRRTSWFLDEMQIVPGWEQFVRRIMDSESVEVFLSGSSADLLSREVATSMRGRAMEALVLPFSFREFLRHRGSEPNKDVALLPKAKRSILDALLMTYLSEGGYPEAQNLDARARRELLNGYVDAALFRDVVERHAVSSPLVLRWMIRQLLANAGGTFSVQKFHNDLSSQGMAVAKNTLHAYLSHLQDAYLVLSLPIATDSERKRMVNPRKAYPIDPGLIAIFDRSGKANAGHALETCVLLELMRRGAEVAWVRTAEGYEVDFFARHGDGSKELIQVCLSADESGTEAREMRALQSALKEHRRTKATIITLRPESFISTLPGIEVVSAAAWLLADGYEPS